MNICLVGSPNSGKSTLFNRLTGLRVKTVNYPGSTVELTKGAFGEDTLIDTPGIYSLVPRSPDEEVTLKALREMKPDVLIVVVDATQAARQLALVLQLKQWLRGGRFERGAEPESEASLVVVLTMLDLLEGTSADEIQNLLSSLSRDLGVPVLSSLSEPSSFKTAFGQRLDQVQGASGSDGFSAVESLRESKQIKDRVWKEVFRKSDSEKRSDALSRARERTKRVDRIVLHPLLGPVLFTSVMIMLFTMIYWLAQPLMDAVDGFFAMAQEVFLEKLQGQKLPGQGSHLFSMAPGSLVSRLVSDGLLAGLAAVFVFVPQIFILFVGLVFLEDSGYLARAASIADHPLRKVGLGGRSFVPLLSGFACSVPAMLATRTIRSKRERALTLFILPLMSCSARLPVYALLLGFLFYENAFYAGIGLAALYLGSIVVSVIVAGFVSRVLERSSGERLLGDSFGREKSFLLLELPIYRRPNLKTVLRQAYLRTRSYVYRTGPVILVLSMLIWAGTTFPYEPAQSEAERIEQSYAGRLGRAVSPVFEPMGGDWRTGLGLISAFAAREVFVSTMAVIFHVTDTDEEKAHEGLLAQMRTVHKSEADGGGPLFTMSSVIGLMLFFMIALQCLSTVGVAMKEAGSLRFAMTQLVFFNLLAYALAVGVVQGLRALGIS